MKLLVASDIHGSAYYAKVVADAFKQHECDTLVLLGDLLYHGPRNPLPKDYDPKQVIDTLSPFKRNIIACRGNCDSEVDQMVLPFSITADYQTIELEDKTIYLSHGHVHHPANLPTGIKENDIFMFGHIHIPICEKQNGITIINPGSISLPKENSQHSYVVIDGDHIHFYNDEHTLLSTNEAYKK